MKVSQSEIPKNKFCIFFSKKLSELLKNIPSSSHTLIWKLFNYLNFSTAFITPMQLSFIAITLSIFFFVICCLIPESPRYQAYCDSNFRHTYEFEKAVKLHNLWSEEDLQRKSIVDLFDELKKLNLLSLIGLLLVEQFIGGISILFYMKHFAQLTGEFKDKAGKGGTRMDKIINLWLFLTSFVFFIVYWLLQHNLLAFHRLKGYLFENDVNWFSQIFPFLTVGGQVSPELIATTVGATLILSIPISKLIRFSKISSTKKQIITSTVAILLCMLLLAVLCVTEGSIGHKLFKGQNYIPTLLFITVTFFYVVGISRNSLLIMQQILSSYSLQLHLRTLSIAVTWIFIFALTKILPQLLYLVGVGYFYCYMAVLTLFALIFLCKIIPSSLNLEVDKAMDKATPSVMETSLMASSSTSDTPSVNPVSTRSSFNEVHEVDRMWMNSIVTETSFECNQSCSYKGDTLTKTDSTSAKQSWYPVDTESISNYINGNTKQSKKDRVIVIVHNSDPFHSISTEFNQQEALGKCFDWKFPFH